MVHVHIPTLLKHELEHFPPEEQGTNYKFEDQLNIHNNPLAQRLSLLQAPRQSTTVLLSNSTITYGKPSSRVGWLGDHQSKLFFSMIVSYLSK